MANLLELMSEADRERLLSRARRRRFAAQDVIVREGERHDALFLVRSGVVRVEHAYESFSIEISRLGPGEVFGEMSFLEGCEASASVVADGEVELDVVDQAEVQQLIDADPGFYGRLYRALAETLSRRLRETTVRSFDQFSWGGRVLDAGERDARPDAGDGWGGGSPFREAPRKRSGQ